MNKKLFDELGDIKKLLVLQLIRDGATSSDIAVALGVSSGRVRQMFPMNKLKPSEK